MSTLYATDTKVSVQRTQREMDRAVKRFGGTDLKFFEGSDKITVVFTSGRVRIHIAAPAVPKPPTPQVSDSEDYTKLYEQMRREVWRSILLATKAALVHEQLSFETYAFPDSSSPVPRGEETGPTP